MKHTVLFRRELYRPEDKQHRAVFYQFLRNNKWNHTCPFIVEEPYIDVVTMCLRKTVDYYMSKDKLIQPPVKD